MTLDFSNLGACAICHRDILIENNRPMDQLECGHFFHGHCISERRQKTNQCFSCEHFMKVICTDYKNPLVGERYCPLPWKLTCAGSMKDRDKREQVQNKMIMLLCKDPKNFLPGIERKNFPEVWNLRWEAAVANLGKRKVRQVIDFFLQRCEKIEDNLTIDFFIWTKKQGILSERREIEILERILSLHHHLCGIKIECIRELKEECEESRTDECWQSKVEEEWYRSGYVRWKLAAKLIHHGFACPDNISQLLEKDKWMICYNDQSYALSSEMVLTGRVHKRRLLVAEKVHKLRKVMVEAGILDMSDMKITEPVVDKHQECAII